MAWIEVEGDGEALVLTAGAVGFAAGGTVWWLQGFCSGAFAYLFVGFAVIMTRQLWLQARLPRDARRAANRVLAWFHERHPLERIEGVAVRAVEPERFVIAVRHGFGMPTPRRYFAVPRRDPDEIVELPIAEWWPRGLK